MGSQGRHSCHGEKGTSIEEIVIAIPTLAPDKRRELLEICQQTACKILMLPGIYQMVNQEVDVSMLREVQIEDLLGRDPVRLKMDEIGAYIENKVILVTGGGGSIGSELCRQAALHNPKQLIILDIYENNAYSIQLELKKKISESGSGNPHRLGPGQKAGGRDLPALPAGDRLPRGGSQACAPDGGQSQRGGEEQYSGHL